MTPTPWEVGARVVDECESVWVEIVSLSAAYGRDCVGHARLDDAVEIVRVVNAVPPSAPPDGPRRAGWWWRRPVCVATGQPNQDWEVVRLVPDDAQGGELVIDWANGHQSPVELLVNDGATRWEWVGPIQPPPPGPL